MSLWFKPLWTKAQSWTIALRHRAPLLDKAVTKLESIAHGLSQHADIWREALAADKLRPKLGPLGEAEMAFLPAALEISERPASTTARIIALTLCAFFAGSIAWASIGELDIVAVASGKLASLDSELARKRAELKTTSADMRPATGQLSRRADRLRQHLYPDLQKRPAPGEAIAHSG
ncbi:MAG: hypothetical protein HY055_14910 [Magnetospirillum sp.]|nr:hypothetical protein [Magnetospirillum sp.]